MTLEAPLAEIIAFGWNALRIVGTYNEPWFCANDVATILGYKNATGAIKKRVDPIHKRTLAQLLIRQPVLTPIHRSRRQARDLCDDAVRRR
jgi:prophage antirepressor-like protein